MLDGCLYGILFWLVLNLDSLNGKVVIYHFCGCLIILKYVLSSLHVYALSFFITLSSIISSIESIFNKKIMVSVRFIGKLSWFIESLFVRLRSLVVWS